MATTSTQPQETAGILITRVRGYNLTVGLLFGGRRRRVDRALVAASGTAPGDRVLDVGSGPGHFAGALAEAVGPTGRVVGLDPSQPMVDYANARTGRLTYCTFQLGSAQRNELPDASFDVVTSTFVMHHIPADHRGTALGHLFRVLRPGGRLLLADIFPTGKVLPALIDRIGPGHRGGGSMFEELDVRRYLGQLEGAGFTGPRFGVLRPWTGYLTATRPA